MNGPFESFQEFREAIRKELEPRTMVQVIVMTIDGQKVVCLGPVLHVPPAGLHVGNIQEIEFGELVPAHLAARLLDGALGKSVGLQ